MTINHFDPLVIGGGQAGLAAGYHISRRASQAILEAVESVRIGTSLADS